MKEVYIFKDFPSNCQFKQGKGPKFLTKVFSKTAFMHEDYPSQVLDLYGGDDSVIKQKYLLGDSKRLGKKQKNLLYDCEVSVDVGKRKKR